MSRSISMFWWWLALTLATAIGVSALTHLPPDPPPAKQLAPAYPKDTP